MVVHAGVTGVGKADSKIALYQDTGGDRGIIAVEVRDLASPLSKYY